ncbi:hypothetical protein Trydic_g2405 [Trypoxylus dichotomus]
MIRTFDIFIVLCLSSFVFVKGQHDHKVKVDVYYESLCTDSIAFITQQLHPALQKPEINKHVNLTLVPYGKSTTSTDGNDLKFSCHHGEGECIGNKIHACALTRIVPTPDGQNKVAFDFINCLLAKVKNDGEKTNFPVKTCAETEKVQVQADIESCAKSHDGSLQLDIYGKKTKALQDPLKSVPTVVFDGKLDAAVNAEAQKNFIGTLCKYIDVAHGKPAECQKSGAEDQAKPLEV